MTDNAILSFLQSRNSANKLQAPGPSAAEFEEIFKAALRAPDHALLRPWRFLLIEAEGRQSLGELFCKATEAKDGGIDDEKKAKLMSKPMRAPAIVALIAKCQEHPKVPLIEQHLSTGCAAQNILLAVEALGYSAIWRTGGMAFDATVADGLGLSKDEKLLGFIYIGSREGQAKKIPELSVADFVSHWP